SCLYHLATDFCSQQISVFFQAEDGIRVFHVTGVSDVCSSDLVAGTARTCATSTRSCASPTRSSTGSPAPRVSAVTSSSTPSTAKIGRASCRERVCGGGGAG